MKFEKWPDEEENIANWEENIFLAFLQAIILNSNLNQQSLQHRIDEIFRKKKFLGTLDNTENWERMVRNWYELCKTNIAKVSYLRCWQNYR